MKFLRRTARFCLFRFIRRRTVYGMPMPCYFLAYFLRYDARCQFIIYAMLHDNDESRAIDGGFHPQSADAAR